MNTRYKQVPPNMKINILPRGLKTMPRNCLGRLFFITFLFFFICSVSSSEAQECTIKIMQNGREIIPGIDNKISTYSLKADTFRIEVDGNGCSPGIIPIADDKYIDYLLKTGLIFSSGGFGLAESPETSDIFGGYNSEDPTTTIDELIKIATSDVDWAKKKYLDLCAELKYCPTPANPYARHWPFANDDSPHSYAEFKRWTSNSNMTAAGGQKSRVILYTTVRNITKPDDEFTVLYLVKPHIIIFDFQPGPHSQGQATEH